MDYFNIQIKKKNSPIVGILSSKFFPGDEKVTAFAFSPKRTLVAEGKGA